MNRPGTALHCRYCGARYEISPLAEPFTYWRCYPSRCGRIQTVPPHFWSLRSEAMKLAEVSNG